MSQRTNLPNFKIPIRTEMERTLPLSIPNSKDGNLAHLTIFKLNLDVRTATSEPCNFQNQTDPSHQATRSWMSKSMELTVQRIYDPSACWWNKEEEFKNDQLRAIGFTTLLYQAQYSGSYRVQEDLQTFGATPMTVQNAHIIQFTPQNPYH